MVGVQEFMDSLQAQRKPIGVGLITLNPDPPGPTMVVEVDHPRFMMPFPVSFDYPITILLAAPLEIIEEVIEMKKAVPVEEVPLWWSFAVYE